MFVPLMMECAFPVGALIGVCPEVITQSLYQVGSDAGTAVGVEIFHGVGKSRDGDQSATSSKVLQILAYGRR